jgi:hypothetical protein
LGVNQDPTYNTVVGMLAAVPNPTWPADEYRFTSQAGASPGSLVPSSAPTMGLADGADEVHKATVARRVLRDYSPQTHLYWPTEFIPAKREAAGAKFEPKFEADPELRASAEAYKKYFRGRR